MASDPPYEEVDSPGEGDEPLARIAARRVVRRARLEAATPGFGRLLLFQASGGAGDALLALALAGSLFFSVPETTARGRVALYLLLTVAPFAVIGPLLSRVLDRRRGGLRVAMVLSSLGRGTCAWLLATRLESLYLFPLAFGILTLSRAAMVVKGALLPELSPPGRPLVRANASLSKVTALAGILAVPPGLLLLRFVGANSELLLMALVYYLGAIPALRTKTPKGRRDLGERADARQRSRSVGVRGALVAAVGTRFLVGFLVLQLAFALRREDFTALGLGLLVGSAAAGALLGALIAPVLRRALKEEGIIVAALFVAGMTSIAVGRFFSVATAAVLVGVFGIAAGALKVAFDAIVQRETPPAARGWAFARYESVLQLAWVLGALIPLGPPIPTGAGVVAVGVTANLLGLIYLVGRIRVRETRSRIRHRERSRQGQGEEQPR